MGDLRAELLAAFEAELADHLSAIRSALADADAGRSVDLRDVSRRAHSLKGAARAVEQADTEALAHEAETLLLSVEAGERTLDAALTAQLHRLLDAIQDSAGGTSATSTAEEVEEAAAPPSLDNRVRVSAQHLTRLARSLHELSGQIQDNGGLGPALDDLLGDLAAITALADRSGADELSRRLARTVNEVERLQREHSRVQWDLDRTTGELERDAERMMLLAVDTLFEGYERMVREVAASKDKAAILHAEPCPAEADRRVLQGLREPVLHLLRNAVGHGIETPAERRRAGKPEQGRVELLPRLSRGRLILTIRDDGRGLDYRRIEAQARAAGLIPPGTRTPPREHLEALVFEQGFSTAEQVDEVSGRGLGLSVVAEAVRRLHGHVSITNRAEGGAEITLSVPSVLSRQSLLLVEAGGERYAVPVQSIDRLLRIAPDEIERSEGGELLPLDGDALPVVALADLVGAARGAPEGRHTPALVLEVQEQRLVVVVDSLHEVRSLVLGDPTAIAADVPLVYGTALVEDGVALVLSPEALLAQARRARPATALGQPEAEAARKTILVVDDSVTTRTLEKSILEAQGYRVLISVDGLAGLERLRSGMEPIDLVVADVEMPRMDGFGLLTAIRNDPALKSLPVVMMTSRNSPDDIERGLALGADAYVTKQEFDQGRLIAIVQQLI